MPSRFLEAAGSTLTSFSSLIVLLALLPLALVTTTGCHLPPRGSHAAARDVVVQAEPETPPPPIERGPHMLGLSLGAGYWPDMGDVDPSSSGFSPDDFGAFEEWGGAFSMSYHHRVTEFDDSSSLWLGGEFGLGSFENERSFDVLTLPSGNTIDGSYSANLIWFTPSLYLHHEFTPQTVGFFGGGAGIYSISLNEEFDGYSDDIDDDTAFGGFLSLGIDFRFSEAPVAIRLESQTHFVELDAFESTLPGDPTVDGPVHFFMIGVVFQPE